MRPASVFASRFGLRMQMFLALAVISALLALVAATALARLASLRAIANQAIVEDGRLSRAATNVALYTLQCRNLEKDVYLHVDAPGSRTLYHNQWQAAYDNLEAAVVAFASASISDADRAQAEAWRAQIARYQADFLRVEQRIKTNALTTPTAASNDFNLTQQKNIVDLTASALAVAQVKAAAAEMAGDTLNQTAVSATRLVGGAAFLALVVAVLWSLVFPARLMRPIASLRDAVHRMAGGDLAARVRVQRADEIGVLAQGFNTMAETIQQRTGDLEAQFARAESARAEAETAYTQSAAQLRTIAEQREVIREMSVPMLPVSAHALVMPLIGALDSQRITDVQEQALRALEQTRVRHLIVDVTGVPVIDTTVALGLLKIVQAARLLGSQVVLTGIRPEVAQTVVGLGVDLADITALGELRNGIEYALR